jgi:hypothetical protein
MTRATFVNYFFFEVIKFYLLMLLYPGELYKLLRASSYKNCLSLVTILVLSSRHSTFPLQGRQLFNVSYQNCCKKTYVNDSQNLAFVTSHFVIELLPFDYLSNQKQWVNKKMHFKRNNSSQLSHIFNCGNFFCRSWHAEHFFSLNFPSICNSFWDTR